MTDARDQAQDRMIEEAEALGADGVINVRFTTSSIADSGAEILAYGDRGAAAVGPPPHRPGLYPRTPRGARPRPLWTVLHDFTASMMGNHVFRTLRGSRRREGVVDRVAVAVGFHRFEALALILLLLGSTSSRSISGSSSTSNLLTPTMTRSPSSILLTLALEGDILDLAAGPTGS